MLQKLKLLHSTRKLTLKSAKAFAGGHHHAPYDWRSDPKVNKDIEEDIRDRGWDTKSYDFPYTKKHEDWLFDITMPSGNY